MIDGPMADVWNMFESLQGDFEIFLTVLGVLLVAAGGIYGAYLAWRKYRTATSRI